MKNSKVKIIILRGPSAVGKTATAKELLLHIKEDLKKNCAYISEDDFRKQMQFKYKAKDKIAHINSAKLIIDVIEKLVSLDSYDVIVIEGLFRYKEMMGEYKKFAKKKGYEMILFQLTSSLELRSKRNKISKLRDHISDFHSEHGIGRGEETPFKGFVEIDTSKPIKKSVEQISSFLKNNRKT